MEKNRVGVTRFKLNPELARYLRDGPTVGKLPAHLDGPSSYHTPRWRVRDRLSDREVADLVAAFKAGTPKWQLAERYSINLKSVKQLLREHGVRKRSRYDALQ